jgi:hypothetical protein
MGRRGPRPQSDELKSLRGNPGLRALNLADPANAAVGVPGTLVGAGPVTTAAIPEFVNRPGEKAAFKLIVEGYLQLRIARAEDLNGYGRYAVYLNFWREAKELSVKTGAHLGTEGTRGLRRSIVELEGMMRQLEDRLGLNALARQQIIRSLPTLATPTRLEDPASVPPEAEAAASHQESPSRPDGIPESPLGFLLRRN